MARRPASFACALALGSLLAVAWGCDAFKPEVPPPPVAPPCDAQVNMDYSNPDGVLQTIADAIAARDCGNGLQAYVGAFSDSSASGLPFYARFADELVTLRTQAGLPVPVWNLPLERDFYPDFVRQYGEDYFMEWTDSGEGDDYNTPGVAVLHRRYEVLAIDNGEVVSSIAVGFAEITMRTVNESQWGITLWTDRIDPAIGVDPADPGLRSMGEWRLELSQ